MIHLEMNSHPRVPTPMREKENKDGGRGGQKRKIGQVCETVSREKPILLTLHLLKERKRNLRGEFIIY